MKQRGIRVEVAEGSGGLNFEGVLKCLGAMQITSLLVEGGSHVNASALAQGVVDKVFFYYAPTILGPEAVPFVAGDALPDLQRLKSFQLHRFGEDFAVEGYLRDPYGE